MASSPPPKIIKLQTSDKEVFEVEESAISLSQTIKNIIEEDADATIPLPNVTARVMTKVVEYCIKHDEEKRKEEKQDYTSTDKSPLTTWDDEFVKGFRDDQPMLFDVILAANYLHISGLLDLTCNSVADMMRGKTPEEIRTLFNIENDYTKEEEDEIRKENAWAFE